MLVLVLQKVVQLRLRQEPVTQKVFPDRFLELLLLPKQDLELKRADETMAKQDFAESLAETSAAQESGKLGFGNPAPVLGNFADPGTPSPLPHQGPDQGLPGDNPGIV